MAELSFNPSSKGGPQGHQTIGQNGSFWLPPKMRVAKNSPQIQPFSTDINNKSKKTLTSGTPLKANSGYKDPSSISTPLNNISPSKRSGTTTSVKASNPVPRTPLSNDKPVAGNGFRAHTSREADGLRYAQTNQAFSASVKSQSPHTHQQRSINGAIGQNVPKALIEINNLKFDGTKSAFYRGNEDSRSQKHKNFKEMDDYFHPSAISQDELLNRVKESVNADTLGLLSHAKGVLRFAFSLDNGSSVSVRIQKSEQNFKICFISNDSETREFLASKTLAFSNSLPIPQDHHLDTYIFSSYKQMDQAFSN